MSRIVDMDEARRKRDLARDFTALKLAALDQAAVDHRLTHLDFRVLYYLASASNRQTQVARRKQEVIAGALGISRRSVQVCAERLNEFGYINILIKDGGSYTNGYQITDDGLPTATIRQGWVTQSPALNELERVILADHLIHAGHPVLRWCFDNVAIHTDSAGNRTMHKGKSRDRISRSERWFMLSVKLRCSLTIRCQILSRRRLLSGLKLDFRTES